MQYKQVVIGIDESYKNSGIAIVTQNQMGKVELWDTACVGIEPGAPKAAFRIHFRRFLQNLIKDFQFQVDYEQICIVYERIRLFNRGNISFDYIKTEATLTGAIEEVAYTLNIPCFSVDTNAWRSKAIGTTQSLEPPAEYRKVPAQKWPTVRWCLNKGYEEYITNGRGEIDNDRADAIGIGFSYFGGVNLRREGV